MREDTEQSDIQTGQLDASFMYESDAISQDSPFVKLTGVNLSGDYTITIVKGAPHTGCGRGLHPVPSRPHRAGRDEGGQVWRGLAGDSLRDRRPEWSRKSLQAVTPGRSLRPLRWLGALLVVYLVYPVGAFAYRVVNGRNEGWKVPGLWSALRVSVEGATISVLIGVVTGIPLAYVLARRRGWLSSAVGVVVQLPLAVPPLISGILLIYIVGPYSFLGQRSGERLTETMYGVVIAQSFVSAPFLVVVARSAFQAVDPSLGDVAATLGHGPLVRFLRVDVPAAADGLRTGMILMWLRAFGEYGTTVVLAYHPYSLPVYVDNLFSSAPLSQAEAPTILAFGVAVVAVVGRSVPRSADEGGR